MLDRLSFIKMKNVPIWFLGVGGSVAHFANLRLFGHRKTAAAMAANGGYKVKHIAPHGC